MCVLVSRLCPTLCNPMDCSLCPWNSLGKNTRAGYPRLLQGIVLTQGLNPDLLHCRQILYHLSHQKGSNNFNNIAYVAESAQFSCSVVSNSLQLHGLQHTTLPCPSPTPGAYSNLCSSSRWYHPTISSSVIPFSCLQSFLAPGSLLMSQFFTSGDQSIGVSASASVLPMNIQDWFPLGLTGWISLQSEGLSRVLSSTTVPKHQFFSAQLSL